MQSAAAEVARGRQCQAQVAELRLLVPIHLGDFAVCHAPTLQMRLDTQRDVKMPRFAVQFLYRPIVQMVVVVVRDQHGIDWRQFANGVRMRHGKWRAAQKDGRGAVEHGVQQQGFVCQFEQQGGMPQPDKTIVFQSSIVQRQGWHRLRRVLACRRVGDG